jgi:hypothetical protein
MVRYWDADGATPGEPTSEAVLLQWLQTPGNYARFLHEPQVKVATEIAAQLTASGLTTRSATAVQNKIAKMKSLCHEVDKSLIKTGHYSAYHSGTAANEVSDAVQKRFPHFDKLSPIFRAAAGSNSSATKRAMSADAGTKTKKVKSSATPTPAPTDWTHQVVVQTPERSQARDSTPDRRELQAYTGLGQSAFESRSVLDVKHIVFMGKEGKQRLVDCEISRQEALAKCQVEGEQKREEVRTVCEKLIARHKCLSAGVPEEVVDSTMPL